MLGLLKDVRSALILIHELWMHPEEFPTLILNPHQPTESGIFLFQQSLQLTQHSAVADSIRLSLAY